MALEIERKFLVEAGAEPPPAGTEPRRIAQGYVSISPDGTEVRLRDAAGRWFLTLKRGSGMVRTEVERELTEAEFTGLWPATAAARLEKDRYSFEAGGTLFHLDVYHGALSGLRTVEVEFDSEEAARAFDCPAWFGPEVTSLAAYKNQSLAVDGMPPHEGESP
ncbi:CYTH domain-containing protein [Streptomyces sp. NPDC004126]|uniref:CYTH domain-containing protein n=1 Tax=Streptomyces sp. NPDC004126 TaxID=3390695 RepID=UPI003D043DDF